MKIYIHATAVVACLLAVGCAEITFKRGASPDAMAAAERECRAATDGEDAYLGCMRERGWFAMDSKDIGKKITGGGEEPAPAPPPDTAEQVAPAATIPPPAAPSQAATAPTEATRAPAAATVPASPLPTNRPTASPTVAAQPDPMARVEVSSWWKLGGTAAGLDAAIAACSTELGEAHRPAPGAKIFTTAMRACLRKTGWRPVGEKPVAP